MKTYVRKALPGDIEAVACNIRLEDALELWKMSGQTPVQALTETFNKSALVYCFCAGDRPAALFGVAPETLTSSAACVWLIGTDRINRCKTAYVRTCKEWTQKLLAVYPVLCNWVDAEYKQAHKWLRLLGAREGPQKACGRNGAYFKLFTFRRK